MEADARFPAPSAPAGGDRLDAHAMIGMARVGAPVASPDGTKVAYAVRRWDAAKKKWGSSLRLLDLAGWEAAGSEPGGAEAFTTQLTRVAAGVSDSGPVFAPDSASLAFTSNRSGSSQVWVLPSLAGPGEATQLTDLPLDVSDLRWGAGDQLFFACAVFPSLSIEATAAKDKELEEQKSSGVNAMSFTSLPVRHWDTWLDSKRNHLFVSRITREPEGGAWTAGEPQDLLAGLDTDCPLRPFGGAEDYSVAPDGSSVVYCCREPPPADGRPSDEAWSTNTNLFLHMLRSSTNPLDTPRRSARSPARSPAAFSDEEADEPDDVPTSPAARAVPGGSRAAGCLTTGNEGYDTAPAFSPDSQQLAYLSMASAGYEADTNRIKIFDLRTGSRREVCGKWDTSPSELVWSADGDALFVTADHNGRHCVYRIDLRAPSEAPKVLVSEHSSGGVCVAGPQGETLLFSQSSFSRPAEVFRCNASDGAGLAQLSHANDRSLAPLRMGIVGELSCKGGNGDPCHSWLIHPPGFDPSDDHDGSEQFPLAVIVHGGPQGAIDDSFHYRWNPQIYAAAGYVVLCVNFHGSTGYGLQYREAISKDWSGAAYDDIIAATEQASTLPYVDRARVGALGASFGGYMMNLMNGRNTDGRFRCLVNHDGIFDCATTYYTTEELYFPEWEFGGPPFASPAVAKRYATATPAALVSQWKTPTLVVHGGKDFRLGEAEGLATFTALQRQGVPSELLYFPTENHWVLNPMNSIVWHDRVLAWLARWLQPAPAESPAGGAEDVVALQLTPTKAGRPRPS